MTHGVISELRRLGKELGAPLQDLLLKKVDLAVHRLKASVEAGKLFHVTYDNLASIEDPRSWHCSVRPARVHLYNVSPTEPVVTQVHLFAEIPSYSPPLSFLTYASQQRTVHQWKRDYLADPPLPEPSQLPILTRGTVLTVEFTGEAVMCPDHQWLQPLIEQLEQTRQARQDFFIAAGYLAAAQSRSDDTQFLARLRQLYEVHRDHPLVALQLCAVDSRQRLRRAEFLQAKLVAILDNEVLIPFHWDSGTATFEPDFLTGGLEVV